MVGECGKISEVEPKRLFFEKNVKPLKFMPASSRCSWNAVCSGQRPIKPGEGPKDSLAGGKAGKS